MDFTVMFIMFKKGFLFLSNKKESKGIEIDWFYQVQLELVWPLNYILTHLTRLIPILCRPIYL